MCPALQRFDVTNPLKCHLGEVFEKAAGGDFIVSCAVFHPGPIEVGQARLTFLPHGVRPLKGHRPFEEFFPDRLYGPIERWVPDPSPDPDEEFGGALRNVGAITIYKDASVSLVIDGVATRLHCICLSWTLLATEVDGSQWIVAFEVEPNIR